MSKSQPPRMNATGVISKILDKIKVAATPDRFTQDFLATELGFSGGGAKAFLPLAKRLTLLAGDGTPTELYKKYRNTNKSVSRAAMAKAIKIAYADMYSRNEYVHSLNENDLKGLIMEMTGLEKGHSSIRAIAGTFEALKSYADFNNKDTSQDKAEPHEVPDIPSVVINGNKEDDDELKLNLSYTINLVLPKTDDVAVFNAIFKSLRENLLKK